MPKSALAVPPSKPSGEGDMAIARQIVLDTETTGLEWRQGDRIIEVACVEMLNRKLTGRNLHYYLNPERSIAAGAQAGPAGGQHPHAGTAFGQASWAAPVPPFERCSSTRPMPSSKTRCLGYGARRFERAKSTGLPFSTLGATPARLPA